MTKKTQKTSKKISMGRLYEEYDDATREIEANQAYTMRLIKKFGQKTK